MKKHIGMLPWIITMITNLVGIVLSIVFVIFVILPPKIYNINYKFNDEISLRKKNNPNLQEYNIPVN